MMIGMNAKFIREAKLEEELGNSIVIKEPLGVVGCVTPWNYPLHQVVCKIAPGLAAGCTLVLKPAEMAPLSAFNLMNEAALLALDASVGQQPLQVGVADLVAAQGGHERLQPHGHERLRAPRVLEADAAALHPERAVVDAGRGVAFGQDHVVLDRVTDLGGEGEQLVEPVATLWFHGNASSDPADQRPPARAIHPAPAGRRSVSRALSRGLVYVDLPLTYPGRAARTAFGSTVSEVR